MLSAFIRSKSKQERLWDACCYGREETVRTLISEGANVNWKSHMYECGPVHIASQGKPAILKLLLNGGCFIDSPDANGNTALHHASMGGHAKNVLILLDAGATVDASNRSSWTPLHNSAYWNHPVVTGLLLSRGADPRRKNRDGRNALHLLCRSKSRDSHSLVENLNIILDSTMASKDSSEVSNDYLSHSGDRPSPSPGLIDERCECTNELDFEADFTPLLFACYHGHLALAEALLLRGADINATTQNGWTALHWAAQRCHADIVELLLEHGASRSTEDLRGDMPCDVTNDLGLRECLLPDPIYPDIVTNGYATTDEEEEDDTSSDVVNHVAPSAHVTTRDGSVEPEQTNGGTHKSEELVELVPLDIDVVSSLKFAAISERRESHLWSPSTAASSVAS